MRFIIKTSSFERTFLEISYEDLVNSTIGYCNLKKAPAIQILKSIDPDRLLRGQDIREKYVIEYSESVHTSRRADYQLEMNDFFHYSNSCIEELMTSSNLLSSSSSGTFATISPFLNTKPSPMPPAIPKSAWLASPGPFTTQPIVAIVIG